MDDDNNKKPEENTQNSNENLNENKAENNVETNTESSSEDSAEKSNDNSNNDSTIKATKDSTKALNAGSIDAPNLNHDKVVTQLVENEMKKSYLDYAMSVIVGRALPDVRDGLKPVHRRILYAMNDLGMKFGSSYKKSARLVGEVLGKYHPHGDSSVYEAMVRMAQPFSLRYMLVDGQGNFGSVDGDSAAAMRYCVTGDTLLMTNKGLIPIGELSKAKKESKIDLDIMSLNSKKNKANKFFNSGKHSILALETTEGYSLRGSSNHPLLCLIKEKGTGKPIFEWKLLSQIKKNDVLVMNRNKSLFANKSPELKSFISKNKRFKEVSLPSLMNKNLAFLLGSLVAEGSFHQEQILFNNKDQDYYSKVKKCILSNFKGVTLYEREVKGDCQELSLYHQKAVQFLINLGLKKERSDKKEIPHIILKSKKEEVKAFLQGLFEGDGTVRLKKDKRHQGHSIELAYHSKSKKLITQLKNLLLNFNIVTTKPYQDKRNNCYKLTISGYENILAFYKNIGFFSKRKNNSLSEIMNVNQRMSKTDHIPFLATYLRKKYSNSFIKKNNFDRYFNLEKNKEQLFKLVDSEDKNLLTQLLKNNYFFNKAASLTKKRTKETVYSIRVDSKCHSFVANGFINHNTEARMAKISDEMLSDIDKETVDFVDNFDGSLKEPSVLPAKIPNLLINGSTGIAVGMATNIPPHNLREVSNAAIAMIDNPEISMSELLDVVSGPDFPTGGIIAGKSGIQQAYLTGKGILRLKSKMHTEQHNSRERIIVTEIPYAVNKSNLLEQIADCVKDKKIEGISDLRDESDRKGMRIVIELKRDASTEVVQNQLMKHTRLQTSFGITMLALVNGVPKVLNLKEILQNYLLHRKEIITRRTEYDLRKAEARAHILDGLLIALADIDEVVKLIKASSNVEAARQGLISNYSLSEIQSNAILDMKLQKLTGLETTKIKEELENLKQKIADYKEILGDITKVLAIIKEELEYIVEKYGDDRKTAIDEFDDEDIDIEDLIEEEDMVVTISNQGYVKRMSLDNYKSQRRGGVGIRGATTKEDDFIEKLFIANTKDYLLVFTDKGKIYWKKTYFVPEATRQSKGKPFINLIQIEKGEKINAVIPIKEFTDNEYLLFVTKKGVIKKTSLSAYGNVRQGGIKAINLGADDDLVTVIKTNGFEQILLASANGQAVKFNEQDARAIGRVSTGVRGIRLKGDDYVVGAIRANDEHTILTVTENGYGKRTKIADYRLINRGGSGVRNIICSSRNGKVVAIRSITNGEDIMLSSKNGTVIRTNSANINIIGRNTQGVKLMNLREGDKVVAVAKIVNEESDDIEEQEE